MSSGDDDQDRAGLEAALEADLQELEQEFSGADHAGDGAAGGSPGPAPGRPGLEHGAPAVDADDLAPACVLAFDWSMRRYAAEIGIPEEELPDDAIPATESGQKIAAALAPLVNKYAPAVLGRWREEIEAAVVVGFATGTTMWQLYALAEELEAEGGDGEESARETDDT